MKLILRLSLVVSAMILLTALSCRNPLFPATGTPSGGGRYRSTPEGTIRQLLTAYENKRIELYRDLFSSRKDFRFYVPPSLVAEHQGRVNRDTIDTQCITISGVYHYWDYDREILAHQRLFSNVEKIEFIVPPYYTDENFEYKISVTTDTLGIDTVGDTLQPRIRQQFDTTNVEIRIWGGQMRVALPDGKVEEAYIGQQVFYLSRDPDNDSLWVISKWFDLGN
jgi:hypothetical protein